jgi:hypothetical protein
MGWAVVGGGRAGEEGREGSGENVRAFSALPPPFLARSAKVWANRISSAPSGHQQDGLGQALEQLEAAVGQADFFEVPLVLDVPVFRKGVVNLGAPIP